MQKYKEINGNDYVKNSRTTINETMQSIQSMNSGTAFPTNNLFEGMKCYRTDLKKTYTLTDVENNTWVEDAHASLSDEATHAAAADTATKVNATVPSDKVGELVKAKMGDNNAFRIAVGGSANNGWVELATADDGTESIYVRQYADAKTDGFVTPTRTATLLDGSGNTSFPGKVTAPNFIGSLNGNAATATKLQTPRTLSLTGKAAGSATFDGSANASINVTSVNADTASKLSTARKINITGNASGAAAFDGTSDVSINVSVSQAAHADKATADANGNELANAQRYMHVYDLPNNTDFNNVKTTGIYTCTQDSYTNRPASSWGVLRVYWLSDNVKQEYVPDNRYEVYERFFTGGKWNAWSKVNAANADTAAACSGNSATATKLATPRTISLTGNATGSASFDGSNNISISTTVNESKHAAAADSATTATKVNATAPNGGTADLVFGTMAVNDYARIRVGGSDDNGWLEIATADGGNEPIYARQYSGAYDWPNGRPGTVTNEAVLLDGNGNTKFPHNVTAANFVGHLAGNADSATKIVNNGNRNNLANGTKAPSGLSVYQCYTHSGYPQQYGNVISIGGTGDNELFLGWQNDARPYYRNKIDVSNDWTSWRPLAFISDINYYAPTKTGSGASGTWGINISGNAGSATNADTVDGYHASDLLNKITAANTGGIVAASLTENGYVKFANGLILQWGNLVGPTTDDWVWVTTTFPIAFASVCFSVSCCVEITNYDYDSNVESMARKLQKTSVDIRFRSDHMGRNLRWIALGT